jgi:hypothetical protein
VIGLALRPPAPPLVPGYGFAPTFAAGNGDDSEPVAVLSNGTQTKTVRPFPAATTGGVRVATADLTGDGIPDLLAGTGPGPTNAVVLIDGATLAEVAAVEPFEATFTGGVFVAAGDLTGDGVPDLVVTPDRTGGPVVAIFDGADLARGADSQLARFFGIEDEAFRGGARPAVGDVDGDGRADLVVSAGFGGGPRVAVFDGRRVLTGSTPPKLAPDFFAFEDTVRNGAFVAAGDLTGDGKAEVVAGGGPGGGPRVRTYLGGTFADLGSFFAGDTSGRDGIRVAIADLNADGRADLLTAVGRRVTGFDGRGVLGTRPTLFALDAGVYVG